MSQYGAKYKYGKASPSDGFDCSGLIFWAYGKHGIPFPATPPLNQKPANGWLPATPGRAILLFSGSADDSTQAWSLIKGASFMHPLPAGYVRMESLSGVYWKNKIVGYRRIV